MKRKERANHVRDFSLMLGAILAAVGALRWYRGLPAAWLFVAAGGLAALLGFTAKPVMRPLYKAGMFVADRISWVVTRVVLTTVFVLVFIPYGLVFRLIGKDLLDRRIHPERETYWLPREPKPHDPKRWERMW